MKMIKKVQAKVKKKITRVLMMLHRLRRKNKEITMKIMRFRLNNIQNHPNLTRICLIWH